MKWKTKKRIEYQVGDIRERVKFAILPVYCEDGYTRWLKKVLVVEKLVEVLEIGPWGDPYSEEVWNVIAVRGLGE